MHATGLTIQRRYRMSIMIAAAGLPLSSGQNACIKSPTLMTRLISASGPEHDLRSATADAASRGS